VSTWQDEHQRWQGRDLRAKQYLYVWADGIYFSPRLEHERQCVLVLIGADAKGKKELLAIDDGFRESEQSWHELAPVRRLSLRRTARLENPPHTPEKASSNSSLQYPAFTQPRSPAHTESSIRGSPPACFAWALAFSALDITM
jgi:Transposase, Mutator family